MNEEQKITGVVYKHAFQKKNKDGIVYLLRIAFNGKADEGEWCTTTDKVYSFANSVFEENEQCTITIAVKDTKQKHIVRIDKEAQQDMDKQVQDKVHPETKQTSAPVTIKKSEPIQAKKLKEAVAIGTEYNTVTRISIEKQVVVKATARSLDGLAGTVNPANMVEVVKSLLKTYNDYMGL